jgi:DNA mismatch repair ATPase MutL
MFRSARSKHESFVRSQAEEYRQILSIAARYAIFHSGRIAMSCRKREHSDSRAFETGTADLCTHANATHLENIQGIFGRQLVSGLGQVSRTHLHRVHCPLLGPDRSAEVVLERAFFSRLGASQSKATHIYFLNGRLVACRMLRKAIEQLYAKYYLKGPHYPFCYVELCMAPEILDINVHPTKKEVRFLDEQIVFRSIVDILERELIQSGEQQSFVVQVNPMLDARSVSTTFKRRASSTTPEEGAVATAQTSEVSSGRKRSVNEDSFMTSGAHQGNVDGDDHKPSGSRLNEELADGWIRLCSEQQERRLSQRFSTQTVPASQRIRVDAHILKLERWHDLNCATSERLHPSKMTMLSTQLPNTEAVRDNPSNTSAPASTGILDLLMLECSDAQSLPIAEVFRQHVFVGAVDERFCLIQFGTALVAVDMLHVLGCFYYQLLLEILQQRSEPTPAIRLRPSWVVETSACDSMTPNPSPTAIPDWASYAGELYRYCGIHLCPHPLCSVMDQLDATKLGTVPPDCWPRTTTGICLYLHSLPWLNLPGACTPCVSALNTFAEELVSARSHTNLCGRIRQVVHGVAGLYANSFVASFTERSRTENPHGTLAGAAERALLLVRDHQSFSPPEKWARDGTLTVVARTERLYRIFERC